MDPQLANLSNHDLFWHARNKYGITNFGQYNGLPSKEQILEAISKYFQNKDQPAEKVHKSTKKHSIAASSAGTKSTLDETRRITRRTHAEVDMTAAACGSTIDKETREVQDQVAFKETKKKTKKTKKAENKENNEPANENTAQEEQKQPKKLTKKTANAAVQQDEPEASKAIKKTKKPLNQTDQQGGTSSSLAQSSIDATSEDATVVKKTKKIVKKKSKTEAKQQTANQVDQLQATEVENEPVSSITSVLQTTTLSETRNAAQLEVLTKIAEKKTKSKKSPKKTKKTKAKQIDSTILNVIDTNTNTNQSDDFDLRLDAEEDDAREELAANQSVMTNDDDHAMETAETHSAELLRLPISFETNPPRHVEPREVLNLTFNKSEEETGTSGRLVAANIRPMFIEKEPVVQQPSNPESALSCSSFYTNNVANHQPSGQNSSELVDEEKKAKKSARIVKPKIKVTVECTEEVTSKTVETIQREAGPRIVKPPEAIAAEPKEKSKKPKSSKTSLKVPDFKAIHLKNDDKLESVSDNQSRVQDRHKQMFSQGSKTPNSLAIRQSRLDSAMKPTISSSLTFANDLNACGSKPTTSAAVTPKQISKSKSNYAINASAQKNTGIPRLLSKKEAKSPNQNENARPTTNATTPLRINRQASNMNTPSADRPRKSVAPNAYPFNKYTDSQNIDFAQYQSGTVINFTGNNNLLATSTFHRRKSFDLNASLMRRLNYKVHTGKLKPLEPVAPGIGLKSSSANLNESKVIFQTKKMKKMKNMDEKRLNNGN